MRTCILTLCHRLVTPIAILATEHIGQCACENATVAIITAVITVADAKTSELDIMVVESRHLTNFRLATYTLPCLLVVLRSRGPTKCFQIRIGQLEAARGVFW